MEQRQIPKTDLNVSVICLGTIASRRLALVFLVLYE